jgi:hypothetical protein
MNAIALCLFAACAPPVAQDPLPFPDRAGPAKRVWCAAGETVAELWFRRVVEIGKGCTSLRIYVSCDNEATVFVGGTVAGTNDSHQELTVIDLLPPAAGPLTVGVHAKNHGSNAALAAWIVWHDAAGDHAVVTDAQWRLTAVEVAEWARPGFDDRRWEAAVGDHESAFGRTVYNGQPTAVRIVSAFLPSVEPIERALADLRAAPDRAAAAKALDALERAVMRARAEMWQKPARPPR